MQEEFDQLFRACVLEESPWEVLCDWLLENTSLFSGKLITEFTCADEKFRLEVERELANWAGDEELSVCFGVAELGVGDSAYFHVDEAAQKLPRWLARQVDLVWYVLSK